MSRTHVAKFWHKKNDHDLQCDLCPRHCLIPPEENGFCSSRKNENGELILTTYGKTSSLCVDPIEKKPLYHFFPASQVLSFGTIGCNLGCTFCQNWHISQSADVSVLKETSPQQIVKSAKELNVKSIAFTYNEPIVFLEYAIETAKLCRQEGIKTVAVTAGYVEPKPREEFFQQIDAANIDLKFFQNELYTRYCQAALQPVLDTLRYVRKETNTWLEITCLIIPGENDDSGEIGHMAKWIRKELGDDVPLHFSAFHPAHQMMDHPPTPANTLTTARSIALMEGLQFVYVGNVYDEDGSTTFCSACKAPLIKRDWFRVTENILQNTNQCPHCGTICPGHF